MSDRPSVGRTGRRRRGEPVNDRREPETVPFEALAETAVFERTPRDHSDEFVDDHGRGGHPGKGDDPGEPVRRRARRSGPLLVLGAFMVIVFGGGYLLYNSFFGVPDYDGPGDGDVILQIDEGDTISAIGLQLVKLDVVRSAKAFTAAAAEDETRARSVQPGYYRVRQRMSGEGAVEMLLDPRSRVGRLDIKGGVQLDDTRLPDGTVAPGVLTQVAQASCAQLNGGSTCLGVDQLRKAMGTAPPTELGVPDWARAEVAKAEPSRRLEGLIAPGRYDVKPGDSPEAVLRSLVSRTAAQYEASGLVSGASQGRYRPYQLLVIASLIEKEGITEDFEKISQVIYNRLSSKVRLEMDSTVNYPLDLQEVRTTAADRGRAGPYNSYANYGLPPTPIGAPGARAIEAALRPEAGPWLFFVKCRKDGTSCFATTLPQHSQNVRAAVAAGAF